MATSRVELDAADAKKFRDNVTRLKNFALNDDEKSRNTLSLLLDELLSVESSACCFQHENEGSELLAYLARCVPLHLDKVVAKVCYLIVNFCIHNNVVLATRDLQTLVQFLTDSLHQCPSFVHTEILGALCAVCENNTYRIEKFHDDLVGGKGLLLQLTDDTTCEEEVVVEAVRCLALFTCMRPNHAECIEVCYLSASFDTFVHLLHRAPHMKMDIHMRHQLLMHCFSGIQNIVTLKRLPNIELGFLFAAVRAYMFYGLTNQPINIPPQLYPNMATPYDPLTSSKAIKVAGDTGKKAIVNRSTPVVGSSGQTGSGRSHGKGEAAATRDKNRNKKGKKKKGRWRGGSEGDEEETCVVDDRPSFSTSETNGVALNATAADSETLSWEMTWLKLTSSDSEYSDTEGGRDRQQKSEMVKVRQSALNCFLNIVRVIDKKVMFGYWSSFIPDVGMTANTPQLQQSLFTTILKDPSPRCRMVAVASLTNMLESTKPYLAAAEETSTHRIAFTSFSSILGSMIREMHRCLLQALVAENFKSVIIQIVKCLANLVNNVPYHRLNPGLLTRVLKQVRYFYNHKDPNVRTACLTCIGAIIGIKPPLLEVSQLVKSPNKPIGVNNYINQSDSPLFRPEDASYLLYPSFAALQASGIQEENLEASKNYLEANTCVDIPVSIQEKNLLHSQDTPSGNKSFSFKTSSELGSADTNLNNTSTNETSLKDPKLNPDSKILHQNKTNLEDTKLNPQSQILQHHQNETNLKDTKLNLDSHADQEVTDTLQKPTRRIDQFEENAQGNERISMSAESTGSMTPVLGTNSGMDTPVYSDQMLQADARETSWVIKLCIKNITEIPSDENLMKPETLQKSKPLPIRLEALQVLSNLIRNYFPVIRQSFNLLKDLIQTCFEDPNHIIKLHGVKVLDELTQALQKDVKDANTSPNHVIPFQQVLEFWLFLLDGPLPLLLNFNSASSTEGNNLVRSGACECMANIGEEVFAKLPIPRQMQCVTLVLGLAVDEDKLIRASAVRAVGVYVMYSGLKEDVAFVLDASKAVLSCMKCSSNSVRFKAAWSMANLCDTLVNNKDKKVEDFVLDFPDDVLFQLVLCAASSTKDSDKISCNAARAVGNLLRYMPSRCFLQPEMEKAIEAAVKGLVKNMNSGTMKVRWNSCYAASNAFQNPDLPTDRVWVTDILNMLSKVVQNCTNFKVRINAALGLSASSTRESYGSRETFSNVWISLVSALETAENINDFAEYKYKDTLVEHLCSAVLHVTSLVQLADLSSLAPVVHIKGHTFRIYTEKYIKLLLAKQGYGSITVIEEVKNHLEKLESAATSDDQRRCLQALLQACVPDTDSADERTPEKTSFQQIYD